MRLEADYYDDFEKKFIELYNSRYLSGEISLSQVYFLCRNPDKNLRHFNGLSKDAKRKITAEVQYYKKKLAKENRIIPVGRSTHNIKSVVKGINNSLENVRAKLKDTLNEQVNDILKNENVFIENINKDNDKTPDGKIYNGEVIQFFIGELPDETLNALINKFNTREELLKRSIELFVKLANYDNIDSTKTMLNCLALMSKTIPEDAKPVEESKAKNMISFINSKIQEWGNE